MLGKLLDRLENTYAHIASEAVRLTRDGQLFSTLLVKLLDRLEVSAFYLRACMFITSEAVRQVRDVSCYLRACALLLKLLD